MTEIIHITPINDLLPHAEEGVVCPCIPTVEEAPTIGCLYVVHRSYDGREYRENGQINPTLN